METIGWFSRGLHSHFLGFIWRLTSTMPINANIKHSKIPLTFVVLYLVEPLEPSLEELTSATPPHGILSIQNEHHESERMGVSIVMGIPQNGWFLLGKSPSRNG